MNTRHNIEKLVETLGVSFTNIDLLHQALVHRSFLNENRDFDLEHNERLEFLGDAVLELIVTENLYNNYPNPEGELTNWRASLVNAVMLASIADGLGIEEFLYLSKGEQKESNSKARNSILANAMEAVIGAMYLDGGYDMAKPFVLDTVVSKLPNILKNKLYMDAKSRLQETAQEKQGVTPHYQLLDEAGPDHEKTFVVGVFLGKVKIASGTGTSKQEAQMAAAEAALEAKGWGIE